MYRLTASVVAHRTAPEVLGRCIRSLLNSPVDVKIYLVDNSSTDELRAIAIDPRITYIFNHRNLGFGAGHNIALRAALGEGTHHLVVNPDVYFGPKVLPGLLDFLSENPGVGLVMPRILYPDGSIQHLCKLLPSPSDLLVRRFAPRVLRGRDDKKIATYELRSNGNYDSFLSVPHLSGCFMLMPAAVLKEVGLFDERFFMYMEDVDFSRRIHSRFRTIYNPQVSVFHDYAKGSYRSKRLLFYHVRSAIRFFNKWGWRDPERDRINAQALNQAKLALNLDTAKKAAAAAT